MNVVNKVVETTEIRHVTEMVPVIMTKKVIVRKTQKEFALNEREALLLRDIFGGTCRAENFKKIFDGLNLGKWTEAEFNTVYSELFNVLNKNVRVSLQN